MSDDLVDMRDDVPIGAEELFAHAAAADARAYRDLHVAVDDFFLPEASRLDERTRTDLARLLRLLVETLEGEIREHAVRLLNARGEGQLADTLLAEPNQSHARLMQSGLLRDSALMAELLARVRLDALGAGLPMRAPDDPERPSLINRYVQHADGVLASGAMAVLIAESRRRGSPETGRLGRTDLPVMLHQRLAWWVAAALRGGEGEGIGAVDAALCDATGRSLAAYEEADRLEAAAIRFAAAVDPRPGELPELLIEALGDRRVVLFVALLAHRLGIAYPQVREMVLDPGGERLWLALRATELPRDAIAQIGFALSEADSRRDLDRFADVLDDIVAISVADARVALAPLRLDPAYRAALMALAHREDGA